MPKNTQVMLMKDLSVELGSKKILNKINLAMRAGERLAIVCLLYTSDAADE